MGSGTTLVEAKLLNRNAVGVDINPQSVSISETNLQFQCETNSKIFTRNGNATDLHFIKDSHIDFICTHPPYANIIKYSKGIEGDISLLGVDEFLTEMCKVAEESFRVLKKGKMCADNKYFRQVEGFYDEDEGDEDFGISTSIGVSNISSNKIDFHICEYFNYAESTKHVADKVISVGYKDGKFKGIKDTKFKIQY